MVSASVQVPVPPDRAFEAFVDRLGEWWPSAYTWSGDVLEEIAIRDGRCYEVGPYSFRCDWGQVIQYAPPESIGFTWQISPTRAPEPDPTRASEVEVRFSEDGATTHVELRHGHFERHGEGSEDYEAAMGSEQGWPYILELYAAAVR